MSICLKTRKCAKPHARDKVQSDKGQGNKVTKKIGTALKGAVPIVLLSFPFKSLYRDLLRRRGCDE